MHGQRNAAQAKQVPRSRISPGFPIPRDSSSGFSDVGNGIRRQWSRRTHDGVEAVLLELVAVLGDALGAGVAAVVTAMVVNVAKNKDARNDTRNFLDPDTLHSPF